MSKIDELRPNTTASELDIPIEWSEAFCTIRQMKRPKSVKATEWFKVQHNVIALYTNQLKDLKDIITCDWSLLDIYGCHLLAPTKRFDCMGLLLLQNQQEKIVEVDKDGIKLQRQGGAVTCYYKSQIASPEQVLLYELS